MTKMTYTEQLKHPNWQRKRLEVLGEADFQCENCLAADQTLHVHHRRYIKGRMAWEYENQELQVLCHKCHSDEHDHQELFDKIFMQALSGGESTSALLGLVAGYLDSQLFLDGDLVDAARALDGHTFQLGLLAGIVVGAGPGKMAEAANILRPASMNPAQSGAIQDWEDAANA